LRPYLRAAAVGPGGATLSVRAEPGQAVRIEASSDLRGWQEVATVIGEEGSVLYGDNPGGQVRFYRLRD